MIDHLDGDGGTISGNEGVRLRLHPVGYTFGMKTAVSIPDRLFRRAEQLADRLGKSRSQLYQEALREYVARREPVPVTAALDEVLAEIGNDDDRWLRAAGTRALERNEW